MPHAIDANPILIFGASTRAAAQSAVRAGRRPVCADLFADEDLRQIARVLPLDRYPDGLIEAVRTAPAAPWIYTGALENRPALLEKLAALRPLLGNPAGVVRAVRDPFRLHAALSRAGLPSLPVRSRRSPPEPDGRWLLKPRHGSAGRGIRAWDAAAVQAGLPAEPCYFQKRAEGQSMSALFVGTGRGALLVGAADQLIGVQELFASPFGYCGSVGPVSLSSVIQDNVARMGDLLAGDFQLRGLFGVDFILDGDVAWPTEVNPRYTASTEVFELFLDVPLLDWHCRVCQSSSSAAGSLQLDDFREVLRRRAQQRETGRCVAKAVLYAPFSLSVPDLEAIAQWPQFVAAGVEIADRPRACSFVPRHAPVCTLIARNAPCRGMEAFRRSIQALISRFEESDSGAAVRAPGGNAR